MVHRAELSKFRGDIAPAEPNLADFIICHDKKTCEIISGKEKDVAKNYSILEPSLTLDQKEIIIETLLSYGTLTDDEALEFCRRLSWKSRVNIIKFIGKTLALGQYNDLIIQTFAELKTKEDKLYEQENSKNEADSVKRANELEEIADAQIKLRGFFTNEAIDRYADFALFDEIGQSTYRKKLITNEVGAGALAKNLAKWGELVPKKHAEIIFTDLMERFPTMLAPIIEEVAKYDEEERPPEILVCALFSGLIIAARREAREKNPEPQSLVKKGKQDKNDNEKMALAWKNYDKKIDERTRELLQNTAKKFFAQLPTKSKQALLERWLEEGSSNPDLENIDLTLLNNWEYFSDVDSKTREKFVKNLSKAIYNLSARLFTALEQRGLLKKVIVETMKDRPYLLREAIEQGFILRAGDKLTREVFIKLDTPENYALILKNPELLAKFSCTPPRERIRELEEHELDYSFFADLEQFWDYTKKFKQAKANEEYNLDENEIKRLLRRAAKKAPTLALGFPKLIKTILDEKFLADLFKESVLNFDSLNMDISAFDDIFSSNEEYYVNIIIASPEIRTKLQELLNQNPEIIEKIGWNNLKIIFTNVLERSAFILNHLDEFLNTNSYLIHNIVRELASAPEALNIFIEKLEEKYPKYLPKALVYATTNYSRQIHQVEIKLSPEKVRRLIEVIKDQIIQNPDLLLTNALDLQYLRLSHRDLFNDLDLPQLVRANIDSWCRSRPEDVWGERKMLSDLLGFNSFWGYVEDNKSYLIDAILGNAHWWPVKPSGNEEESKQNLKLLLKETFEQDPTKLYSEDGTLNDAAYRCNITNAREKIWKLVSPLPFFDFYSKKLRNLLTASEDLEREALEPEFIAIVKKCQNLSSSPLKNILLRSLAKLPRKKAEKILDQADALITVGGDKEFAEVFANESDPQKIQAGLEKQISESLSRLFDIRAAVTNKELITSPRSLLLYANSHQDNERLQSLLRTMVSAEANNQFKEWKFFEQNEDQTKAFAELQSQNLLPKNLSFEQYKKWIRDIEKQTRLDLHIDIGDVLQINTEIVRQALSLRHLTLEGDDNIFSLDKNIELLLDLEKPLREMPNEQRGEYLKQVNEELIRRRANVYLDKILLISSEEALTGQLKIEGVGMVSVNRAFRILHQAFGNFPEFINDLGKIQANVEAIAKQHETTQQKLIITDETSFITALEIGAKPVSTCQNIRGSKFFNKALLAYGADPGTKIFVVKGENGKLIARAIARLLEDKNGQPVLFLEGVYTASPSPKISAAIIDFAKDKAKEIGIRLAVSSSAKGQMSKTAIKLQSFNSRNEYVYTDDGGGLKKDGKFTIMKAYLINT